MTLIAKVEAGVNDHGMNDLEAWSVAEATQLGLDRATWPYTIGRVRLGLGGSHTVVTYPPLDALEHVPAETVANVVKPTGRVKIKGDI